MFLLCTKRNGDSENQIHRFICHLMFTVRTNCQKQENNDFDCCWNSLQLGSMLFPPFRMIIQVTFSKVVEILRKMQNVSVWKAQIQKKRKKYLDHLKVHRYHRNKGKTKTKPPLLLTKKALFFFPVYIQICFVQAGTAHAIKTAKSSKCFISFRLQFFFQNLFFVYIHFTIFVYSLTRFRFQTDSHLVYCPKDFNIFSIIKIWHISSIYL